MKKLYTILIFCFILLGGSAKAQSYFVYTALKGGTWNDNSNWNIASRTDGVKKNKVIIPNPFVITADNGVNSLGLGDVDIVVGGTLKLNPGTALTLGTNSTLELLNTGNINANTLTQTIAFGPVIKYMGSKDAIKTGPSIADALTGVSPLGFRTATLLPVNFLYVQVTRGANAVSVNWSVANEVNNKIYLVERSADAVNWSPVGTVMPIVNNEATHQYGYSDKTVTAARAYYRIKQVDIDGAFTYSDVKMLNAVTGTGSLSIYASSKTNVAIRFTQDQHKQINVRVMNFSGHVFTQQTFSQAPAILNVNVISLPAGMYVVQVTDNAGWSANEKIMIQ